MATAWPIGARPEPIDALWGTNPKGLMIFTADGHYFWQIFRSDRPKFASKNRMQGTPEENAASLQGSLSYFGTYSVDEAKRTIAAIVECDGPG